MDLDFLISFFPTSKRWWKLWWFTNGLRKRQSNRQSATTYNNNNQYPTKTKNVVLSRIILMGLARTFPEYHRNFLEKKKKPTLFKVKIKKKKKTTTTTIGQVIKWITTENYLFLIASSTKNQVLLQSQGNLVFQKPKPLSLWILRNIFWCFICFPLFPPVSLSPPFFLPSFFSFFFNLKKKKILIIYWLCFDPIGHRA